jgi:3-deoxy-manno-octulosonate cytidylyltransferase (CMP-KDO synthetase)
MIQWVYERASTAEYVDRIIIATDNDKIYEAAKRFEAPVIMTAKTHNSGTLRVSEAARSINSSIIINIQGDEPLIQAEMIDLLIEALQNPSLPMATLAARETDLGTIQQEGTVKVIMDNDGYALYFSRSPIPFRASEFFWRHIGIYGFQKDFLLKFPRLPVGKLEQQENLEQLRALENGFRIKVLETKGTTMSVDHPENIAKVERILNNEGHD